MPWDTPPDEGLPTLRAIDSTLQRTLEDGSERIRTALEAGTPVDTGEMRDSWLVEPRGPHEFIVANFAPHERYVSVDTEKATLEARKLGELIGTEINLLFGGRRHG